MEGQVTVHEYQPYLWNRHVKIEEEESDITAKIHKQIVILLKLPFNQDFFLDKTQLVQVSKWDSSKRDYESNIKTNFKI